MVSTVVNFCLLGLLSQTVSAAYRTTFPFENEAYVPPDVVESTPSYTFTPDDLGGYIYTYWWSYTVTEADFAATGVWCIAHTDLTMHLLVNTFAAPPVLPESLWNCTDKEIIFAASDFTGILEGGNTICQVGSCCSNIMGMPKFSDDQMDFHSGLGSSVASALCGDMPESLYCIMVGGDFNFNCHEYFTSADGRTVVFPCSDTFMLFFLDCPVFKSNFALRYTLEPDAYVAKITNEEYMALEAVLYLGDKVCHPYSYYNPNAANSGTDSSSSSTPSNSTPASESAASTLVLAALFFIAITVV